MQLPKIEYLWIITSGIKDFARPKNKRKILFENALSTRKFNE